VKTNCTNILVENCTFANGHGASIGSEAGFTHDIVFRNIVFNNTMWGARIKSFPADYGQIYNVTYDNLELHGVQKAIYMTQFYNTDSIVQDANNTITNVTVSNVVAYNTTDITFFFNCSDNNPCTGFVLSNITSYYQKDPSRYLDPCISFHAAIEDISPPFNGTLSNGELNCAPIPYLNPLEAFDSQRDQQSREPTTNQDKRQHIKVIAS